VHSESPITNPRHSEQGRTRSMEQVALRSEPPGLPILRRKLQFATHRSMLHATRARRGKRWIEPKKILQPAASVLDPTRNEMAKETGRIRGWNTTTPSRRMCWSILLIFIGLLAGCETYSNAAKTLPEPIKPRRLRVARPGENFKAVIKVVVHSSTWEETATTYDIVPILRQNLEKVGILIAPIDAAEYDATLTVNYRELQGPRYFPMGFGTRIECEFFLTPRNGKPSLVHFVAAETDYSTRDDLLSNARDNFVYKSSLPFLGVNIVYALGGAPPIDYIIELSHHEAPKVREEALEFLHEIDDPRASRALNELREEQKHGVVIPRRE
jgi:hypothetical protein